VIRLRTLLAAVVLEVGWLAAGYAQPAAAVPGDVIADVGTPEAETLFARGIAKAIGFDGRYLYYTDYAGSELHRIDVPPAGGPTSATGHVDTPITGATSGIMAISYDASRDMFWAVGGDGLTIYLLSKTGTATLRFTIDPATDRPGNCGFACQAEAKINYDGADDTIWYATDASQLIYHYKTSPDALGTADLVAATPYIDVSAAPNDMRSECGYSQASGLAVGGDHLFVTVGGCPLYFEYTKTGSKVGSYPERPASSGDFECDNVSYGVSVIWARGGWDGRIRAYEQPTANACAFGGGPRRP
jgi:hypothetical protein